MIARTARFNEIPFPFLYMPPSPTLPSDHSSASCTRADVRICPAIHRLGQRMVKLKNLWRNLCPHGQDISTIYPPRQKLFVFASWIFERKDEFIVFVSRNLCGYTPTPPSIAARWSLFSPPFFFQVSSHIDDSSLISRGFFHQFRTAQRYRVRAREKRIGQMLSDTSYPSSIRP